MLIEKLRQDLKDGMKEKDTIKKSIAQLLIAAIRNKEIDEHRTVTPEDENAILSRELKQTKEALEIVVNSPEGHEAAIEELKAKIKMIQGYMPEQMSEEEVFALVKAEIEALNLPEISPKVKGLVMKNIMPKLKGKAEGKVIDKAVNDILNG
jgi:uncharacterized protein YqeY